MPLLGYYCYDPSLCAARQLSYHTHNISQQAQLLCHSCCLTMEHVLNSVVSCVNPAQRLKWLAQNRGTQPSY